MKINTPKIIVTLFASVCLFFQTTAQKEKQRIAAYIEQYKELAISEMMRTGVPASITLAQGVLETGFGQSDLAVNANNHFGIKCKTEWKGERVYHDDDSKGECFRKYPSAADSYRDHSDFLKTRAHYAFLFQLDPTDYSAWSYGLKKAGYATNPSYPQRLMKIIEENNLQQYTLLAIQRKEQPQNEILASNNSSEAVRELEVGEVKAETLTKKDEVADNASEVVEEVKEETRRVGKPLEGVEETNLSDHGYPSGKTFLINATKVLFADGGTSLLAIANIYKVAYSKLLEFNELDKADILSKAQLIFLEKKPKKGMNEVHIVAANENLRDIVQKEGIQLNAVLELNNLQKGMTPAVGEKLYLKAKSATTPKLASSSHREPATSMR